MKGLKGDQVQINSFAFYNTPTQDPGPGVNLLQDLLGMVTGGIVGSSGGKLNATNTTAVSNALSPHLTDFLNNDRDYDNSKPKAYLNWVLFDNQFNFIAGSSGVVQVQAGSTKQPLVAPLQTITKNGYLYVYVSNESPQPVYFDDLTVRHTSGPLMQEQAYYPYGLQMAGISDRAVNKTGNPFKFNAGSELEDEDGLEYYNTFFRKYDAQIGRFTGIDMLAEEYADLSPYHFGANNPAMFNDPTGLQHSPAYRDQNGNKWHNPGVLHGLSGGYRSFDWYKDYDLGSQDGGNAGVNFGNGLRNFVMGLYGGTTEDGQYDVTYKQNKNGEFGFSYKWWEAYSTGSGDLLEGVKVQYGFFENNASVLQSIAQSTGFEAINTSTELAGMGLTGYTIGQSFVNPIIKAYKNNQFLAEYKGQTRTWSMKFTGNGAVSSYQTNVLKWKFLDSKAITSFVAIEKFSQKVNWLNTGLVAFDIASNGLNIRNGQEGVFNLIGYMGVAGAVIGTTYSVAKMGLPTGNQAEMHRLGQGGIRGQIVHPYQIMGGLGASVPIR